ncbi:hypothetical protein L461_04945 [Klebsiella pneumoniae BIDMC 25]|nr:hypothetical protein L461_04945 [Klebsiella pneumoniae BIDMC 25]
MSANHAAFNLIFRFVENYISPIAGRISSQRHVMAIRDGFISAMPFMIVGSFLLVFAYPPFSPDTTWGFARAWLDLAKEFEGRILTPFDMTMGIMSIYICAAISYNLGKHYEKSNQLDPFMCAMLSIMAFLLIAAPKTNGALPVDSLGGDRDLYRHPGGDLLRGDDAFLESAQHWDPLAGPGSADDQKLV